MNKLGDENRLEIEIEKKEISMKHRKQLEIEFAYVNVILRMIVLLLLCLVASIFNDFKSMFQSNGSMNSSGEVPFWRDQEEIVITGISGRFPRCENVQEFGDLLLAGEDLVTEDSLRWPPGSCIFLFL